MFQRQPNLLKKTKKHVEFVILPLEMHDTISTSSETLVNMARS